MLQCSCSGIYFLHTAYLTDLIHMVNVDPCWKCDSRIILLPMSWSKTRRFRPLNVKFEHVGKAEHHRNVHLQKQRLRINIGLAAPTGKRHYLTQRDSFVAHTQWRGKLIESTLLHKLRRIWYSFQWETNTCSVHHPIILLHYFSVITMLILHVLFSFLRITFSRLLPPDAKC